VALQVQRRSSASVASGRSGSGRERGREATGRVPIMGLASRAGCPDRVRWEGGWAGA
jgi:hypothetical protein